MSVPTSSALSAPGVESAGPPPPKVKLPQVTEVASLQKLSSFEAGPTQQELQVGPVPGPVQHGSGLPAEMHCKWQVPASRPVQQAFGPPG